MSELLTTYARALTRYIEHSEEIVNFANTGLIDHLLSALKARDRVYANLRALDALANHKGIDPRTVPEIATLGKKAAEISKTVEEPLQRAQEHLAERLQKLNRNSDVIKRTMSQRSDIQSRYLKAV